MSGSNPNRVVIVLDADWTLTDFECWPDGEPENWGANEIASAIKDEGTLARFLERWSLDGVTVRVHAGPTTAEVTLR